MTIAERRASFDAICGDRRFDYLRYAITDYSAVASYEVTSDATAEIAALHIGPLLTNSAIIMAAVVERADIVDAIMDFKRYRFTVAPYHIFRTLDEARMWVHQSVDAPSQAQLAINRFAGA